MLSHKVSSVFQEQTVIGTLVIFPHYDISLCYLDFPHLVILDSSRAHKVSQHFWHSTFLFYNLVVNSLHAGKFCMPCRTTDRVMSGWVFLG